MLRLTAFLSALLLCGCDVQTPKVAEPPEAVVSAIKAEPAVKELYVDLSLDQWNIAVTPNGQDRYGLALYFCEVLSEVHAVNPYTTVRIVDVTKIARGIFYKKASLALVRCSSRKSELP